MLYQPDAPGDWGHMIESGNTKTATEMLKAADECNLFLRSWVTGSNDVLLILHGLGAHSGWFIDMGNTLSSRGINVYATDHRGFGRSGGLPGHIDDYHTYIEDINVIVTEIHKRHPQASLHILGHSMGGIFASHFAAQYENTLESVLFLNPWIQDTSQTPLLTTLGILLGGVFKSHHYWQVTGGPPVMTTNSEAVQMLNADTYWCRKQTASLLFQIFQMRLATLKKAKIINKPSLVMQAEADKSVVPEASHNLYETLASEQKTWKTLPAYAHDSEFETDRSLLDNEILAWLHEHVTQVTGSKITQ